jgi:inner membrane protein
VPSPIGHALASLAVGWLAAPDECRETATAAGPTLRIRLPRWRWPAAFVAAGLAADLDLLVGLHSRYTHSVGAVAVMFVAAWLALKPRARRPVAVAVALALCYASHLLLDLLGSDTSPPLGIMALWPLSSEFYLSPVTIFGGISRRYWLAAAWVQNARSVARELLLLAPPAALVWWFRVRSGTARRREPVPDR